MDMSTWRMVGLVEHDVGSPCGVQWAPATVRLTKRRVLGHSNGRCSVSRLTSGTLLAMGPAMGQESFTFIKIIQTHTNTLHLHHPASHNTNHHIIWRNYLQLTNNHYIIILPNFLSCSPLCERWMDGDSDTSWQLIHSSFIQSRRNQQKVPSPNVEAGQVGVTQHWTCIILYYSTVISPVWWLY